MIFWFFWCLFFLIIYKRNPTYYDQNFDFTDKLQNFIFTSIYLNKVMLRKMRLSNSPQSSLLAQFLSASIKTVCLNSWKMFMTVKLQSCMGSCQRVMNSMFNFNTTAVPVLQHIGKFWLKTIFFSNNEFLPRYFLQGFLWFLKSLG